ncbi:MAG: single-stranded DNA-binding protein [Magnetococcales bacterium]|nr:single-stranded DNA-binding protein [Magnetococcales bacterium]
MPVQPAARKTPQKPSTMEALPEMAHESILANELILGGLLLEPAEMRTTPSGKVLARMELAHHCRNSDLPPIEEWAVRMTVLAVGPLAEQCRLLFPGARIEITGRLNQKRWLRDGQTRWGKLELVARKIRTLTFTEKVETP